MTNPGWSLMTATLNISQALFQILQQIKKWKPKSKLFDSVKGEADSGSRSVADEESIALQQIFQNFQFRFHAVKRQIQHQDEEGWGED